MRSFIQRIVKWYHSNPVAKPLVKFITIGAVTAVFFALTAAGVFEKAPIRVPPSDYLLQKQSRSAVELEQQLKSTDPKIDELVFFKDTNFVVVVTGDFEQEVLVLNADTAEVKAEADAAKVPYRELPSATTPNPQTGLLTMLWFMILIGIVVWFGFFLFKKPDPNEQNVIQKILDVVFGRIGTTVSRLGMKQSTAHLTSWIIGLMLLAALLSLRAIVNDPLILVPSEYRTFQPTSAWQVERQLKHDPSLIQRVAEIEDTGVLYVQIIPPAIEEGNETAAVPGQEKKAAPQPMGRLIHFGSDSAGKTNLDKLVVKLKAADVPFKSVAPELDRNVFNTMPTPWTVGLASLGGVLVIWGIVILSYWSNWRESEGPTGRNGTATAGGRQGGYSAGGQVMIRDEDRKTFADVAGCQEAIDELRVVEKKIRRPKLYKVFGAPVPSGVMLYGPPGTGKTLMARALSGEIGGHFEALSGSQFVEMYVGVGARRVRDAYSRARKAAQRSGRISIIFIDEIDAIAKKRGNGEGGGDKEYEQTLNELLVQMNGFGNHGLVLTMAATNRLDILDDAILRPGRFDIKVQVPKPDKKGRAQIYGVYLKKLKILLPEGDDEANRERLLDDLARRSHDFSGAEIEGAVKNAATIAVERMFGDVTEDITDEQLEEYQSMAIVTVNDLNEGVDKMAYGTQIKSRIRTDSERWATAIHEVGHATVPTVLKGDPVNRITIVMTDKSLGLMDSSPEEGERYDWTKDQFRIRLQMMLAGRAAEKIILSKISTGASNDFERASQLARQMVGVYGMSEEFGVKSLPLDRYGFPASNIGEIMLDKFNRAWGDLIDEMEKATEEIIEKHRAQIEAVAKVLYDNETMTGAEFRALWQEHSPAEEVVA